MTQTLKTKVLIVGAGAGGYVACHRMVDGHDAAVFVQRIKGLQERPATLWTG